MIDRLIALLALAILAAFLLVIVWFVPEPDLMVVVFIAIAMAAYDFLPGLLKRRRGP